jgi:hypothetical protein
MALIFGSTQLVLNAYAVLVDETPGNAALNEHKAFIAANGEAAYKAALNSIFSPTNYSTAQLATTMLANLGLTNAWPTAQADAEAYLNAYPTNRVGAMMDLAAMLYNYTGTDAVGVAAAAYRADIGTSYAYSIDAANVAGKALVGTDVVTGGQTLLLTVGQDNLSGGASGDTFNAYIFDNQNTAQSGDMVNGFGGIDRLMADIGNSQNFAITLHTESVEQFAVRAQDDNNDDSSDNNMNDNVQIDAERMEGTVWYETNNSRADVVIEDVRIERIDAYNDATNEITRDITIAMVSTDPGDVDMDVYFDVHSLVKEADNQSNSITLTVGNQVEVADFNAAAPLENLPYTDVSFLVDGQTVTLDLAANGVADVSTYADMWVVVQAAFAQAKASAAYADLLANVTLSLSTGTDTFFSRDGVARSADEYVLSISGGAITTAVIGWTADDGLPSNNAFSARVVPGDTTITSNLITSTVVLDDVGRGSMGGDLVIGALSTGETSDSTGVEQFDIYVDRNSELQNITSTDNTLEEVYVYNRDHFADNNTTATGSLTVTGVVDGNDGGVNGVGDVDDEEGKSLTIDQYGFNDLRVFDASAMVGAVNITAVLTDAIVAKYLDLTDTATNSGADNRTFEYDLGTNSDKLILDISQSNLEVAGTTTREDFLLAVNGNAGDDWIKVSIGEDSPDSSDDATNDHRFSLADNVDEGVNWYENSEENGNISIDAGSGNDFVWTEGAGDAVILAGSGNDTVYTDNSGNNDARAAVSEVQTITFGAAGDRATQSEVTVTFSNGTAVTTTGGNSITTGLTAAQVAENVAAQINANGPLDVVATTSGANVVLAYGTGYAGAGSEDIANAVVTGISTDVDVTAPVATTTNGGDGTAAVAATTEVAMVQLTTIAAASGTVTFDNGAANVTLAVTDTDGNGVISLVELTNQIVAGASTVTNWSLTESNASLGRLLFTSNTAGAVDDLAAAGTGIATYTNAGAVTVETLHTAVTGTAAVAYVAGTAEVQTVTVTNGADQAGTVTMGIDTDADGDIELVDSFDGDGNLLEASEQFVFNISAGNEAQVAAQLASQINALTGVSAAQGAAGATIDDVIITWDVKGATSDALQDAEVTTFIDGGVKSASVAETVKGLEATGNLPATWVVNTVNTVLNDLDSAGPGVAALLYKASLTVTFSGATTRGASGVTDGAAVANSNGFESTVTIGTTNYLGNHTNINQAIKDAIIGDGVEGGASADNVLEEFLSVNDGPANTIAIHSLIDGEFAENDLAITMRAVNYSGLSGAEQNAIVGVLRALDHDSTMNYTTEQVQARLDAAVEIYANSGALDNFAMATTDGTTLIAGSESWAVSDNLVTLGTGDDVIVLGTDYESNDMLVYTGSDNGKDTVMNFTETGSAADSIDFSAYLSGQTSHSGSAASTVTPAITLNDDAVADINEVTIINNFAPGVNQTWSGLTAENLRLALNNDGTEVWGSIDEADLNAANIADLVGTTYNHIVMVENNANDGEYKVYNLVATDNGDFTAASFVGIIDFGDTLDAVTSANFDGTLFV